MRNFLLKLAEKITGPRYHPEDYELDKKLHWSSKVWVSNIFRAHEWLFGKRFGIRAENSSSVSLVDGRLIVKHELYSFEAHVVHIEVAIRLWLSAIYDLIKLNPQPNYSYRPTYLTLGFLGLSFFFKTKELYLPLFGLAIALDTTSQGTATSTSPLTWSATCTGSNLVLICTPIVGASSPTLSTPTYAAVNMVLADVQRTTSTLRLAIYYKLGPATGSNTVSVGFAGTVPSCHAGVVSWSGVAQSSQPDATAGNTSSGANPSLTVTTVADNCWVVGVAASISGAITANLTSRQALDPGGTFAAPGNLQDTNGPKTPAGNQTVSWTYGTGSSWGAEAASYSPAAGGAAAAAATGFMTPNTGFWG